MSAIDLKQSDEQGSDMSSTSDPTSEYEEIALHLRVPKENAGENAEPLDLERLDLESLLRNLRQNGADGIAGQLEQLGLKVKIPVTDIPQTPDQSGDLAAKDGCISNPGGPSC